jgi:hypothetical protein
MKNAPKTGAFFVFAKNPGGVRPFPHITEKNIYQYYGYITKCGFKKSLDSV